MNCALLQTLRTNILLLMVGVVLFVGPLQASAQFNPEINYQGKLTNATGVAVPDGTYNINFWLVPSSGGATSTAVWSEARTGANRVQVTDGLFSVMLGDVSTLASVDFNQTLYLAVEIGGTGTPAWDGELLPRKVLGAVPAAFVAETAANADNASALGGVASSSFLRSDEADTMTASSSSSLLTMVQNGIGKILSLFSGATEVFTVLNNGNVGIGTSTPAQKLHVDGGRMRVTDGSSTVYLDTYIDGTSPTIRAATPSGNLLNIVTGSQTFTAMENMYGGGSYGGFYMTSTDGRGFALRAQNDLVFSAGTSAIRMIVASTTGNVGIGTTSPASLLHVSANTNGTNRFTLENYNSGSSVIAQTRFIAGPNLSADSDASYITRYNSSHATYPNQFVFSNPNSASDWNFITSATSRLFIDGGTGNVGIGTTTPGSKLTVVGDIYATGAFRDSNNAAGTAGRILQTTGTGTQWVATSTLGLGGITTFLGLSDTPGSFTANRIPFTNSGATALTDSADFVFDGTNLGIGTSTPAANLHIYAGSGNVLSRITWIENAAEGGLIFYQGSNYYGGVEVFGSSFATIPYRNSLMLTAARSDAGTIIFRTRTNDVYQERMIITNLGNLGIGTTTPSQMLSVGSTTGSQFLVSSAGVVTDGTWSADTIAATRGGTGLSTITQNQLLIGGAGNTWSQIATSSLGLSASFTTSAGLAALLSDEVGTGGGFVRASSTMLTSPHIVGATLSGTISGGTFSGGAWQGDAISSTYLDSAVILGTEIDTSAELAAIVTDATGSGALVFGTSPTISGTLAGDSATFSGTLGVTGTTTLSHAYISGELRDGLSSAGTSGMVLQTTGTSTQWVATSTLGFSSGASTFLDLTDTPGSYTANRIMFTNSGATALTDSADFTYDGSNLGLGGDDGIAFGGIRLITASTTNDSIAFGENAGATFNNQTTFNTAIGYLAGRYASTTGSDYNNFMGYQAGYNNTGANNNLFGYQAGYGNTGSNVVAIGYQALGTTTAGNTVAGTVGIGYQALLNNTTGSYNTAVGSYALSNNVTGYTNSAFGRRSLVNNSTGAENSAFGEQVLEENTIGDGNSAFGNSALEDNFDGNNNSAFGIYALNGNITGSNNSAFGTNAGRYLNDGVTIASTTDNSVYLGYGTRAFTNNDQNTIVIGYNTNGLGSNTVVLGNDSITTTALKGNVGIGTTTPSSKLTVVGDVFATGAFRDSVNSAGTLGMVLQTTGTTTQWVATSTLGITGGVSTFLALTDTPSSYTANRIMFTNSGATALTDSANFVFDGTNLGIGTTTPSYKLTVDGAIQASSTSNSIFGNGTTGGLTIGDSTFTKTNGSHFQLGSGIDVAAGSAALPSFGFTSDTNTGIYSSGADALSFSTGGTERLRVYSNGNLAGDDFTNLPGAAGNSTYKIFHFASPTETGSTMLSMASRNFSTSFFGNRAGE